MKNKMKEFNFKVANLFETFFSNSRLIFVINFLFVFICLFYIEENPIYLILY